MDGFVSRFKDRVTGVLSGFDRLVLRGTLIPLVRERCMHVLLARVGKRLLDFKDYALKTSERVKNAALAEAREADRPVRYIERSSTSKEDLARALLDEHPVDEGLVCVFKAIEPCMSFECHRSQDPKERGLKLRPRKCLHIYKYFLHPLFGFMNARIQTWFPFNIQVCLNGREWLARLLERKGIGFKRHDNCFTALDDIHAAQRLMNKQLETDWPRVLTRIARTMNPLHEEIFALWPMDYYWSAYQTEWPPTSCSRTPARWPTSTHRWSSSP